MLYLSGFELYSRWVPLKDPATIFTRDGNLIANPFANVSLFH